MGFRYSKENLNEKDKRLQRFLEMVPGTISWTILLGMFILSMLDPIAAAIFVIAFLFYWFMRLLYITIFLMLSYSRMDVEKSTDWMERVSQLDRVLKGEAMADAREKTVSLKKRLSRSVYESNVLNMKKDIPPLSSDIYHIILFPVATEPPEVIDAPVSAVIGQTFPLDRIALVYAVEENAPEKTRQAIAGMQSRYKDILMDFLIVEHPRDIPGEAKVKGANATYAARKAREMIKERNILSDNVLVSCLDADTVIYKDYCACLTYSFMVTPDRCRVSYQPIPVYNNNIWEVPAFSRVMEIGSSFFQLVEATNTEKLVTFSSHSMSLKSLEEVGYWPVDMISDDSAIFWKAYVHYNGSYRAVPMYITVSMDATYAGSWISTMKNIYKQRRRWAYGVENFPILVRGFLQTDKISFYNKMRHLIKMLDSHISWATWGFLLTTIGWLPAVLAGSAFHRSVLYYNVPYIAGTIFNLSTFSLIISIFLSISILPKKKIKHGLFRKIKHAFEWMAIPFILLFLNALPALDAQTRLIFGKYMEFWVTDKSRKK